jgi:uncharacterized protein (UPF0335 family)
MTETTTQTVAGIVGDHLRAFIERIERLEAEKADLASDIKEVYAEAKGNGFDTKIIRALITMRKQNSEQRQENEELLSLYKQAIGLE